MPYPQLTSLSKTLWQRSLPIFENILTTPFVTGLINGLSQEDFHRFTQQDIYYLETSFQPAMEALREKAPSDSHKQLFSNFITATHIELAQLKSNIGSNGIEPSILPSEICLAYGQHLLDITCNQSYGVGIAACLPCFLFFPAIGWHVKNNVCDLSNHPQAGWIKVYAEELFDNAYQIAALANDMILKEDENMALAAYMTSAEFEFGFFKDALELDLNHSCSMTR